jgi:hypothetical protein
VFLISTVEPAELAFVRPSMSHLILMSCDRAMLVVFKSACTSVCDTSVIGAPPSIAWLA